jgi:hypothetical protein
MGKSETSEDLAARCESIRAVGRTHANDGRPKSLALSVVTRRCLACILDLLLLPKPKCRSSKCLRRFLDWRRIAPHSGHDAGWSDKLRAFDNPSPKMNSNKAKQILNASLYFELISPWTSFRFSNVFYYTNTKEQHDLDVNAEKTKCRKWCFYW